MTCYHVGAPRSRGMRPNAMADKPANGTARTYVAIAAAVTFVLAAGTAPWAA